MKPAAFDYLVPATVDEVVDVLAERADDAKLLAGGQSLVPLMNMRLVRPALVIDINRVAGLDSIVVDEQTIRIGALARWRAVERSAAVIAAVPVLPRAIGSVGHPQIRNRGTLGGSAVHADPAAELPAVLVALEARLRLRSRRGEREVPALDFFLDVFTTALAEDELLIEIVIPRPPAGAVSGFAEFARRSGDFAIAGAVRAGDRLVGFGAGPRPVLLPAPGPGPDGELEAAVAGLPVAGDIHGDADWRRSVLLAMARRAWGQAA